MVFNGGGGGKLDDYDIWKCFVFPETVHFLLKEKCFGVANRWHFASAMALSFC